MAVPNQFIRVQFMAFCRWFMDVLLDLILLIFILLLHYFSERELVNGILPFFTHSLTHSLIRSLVCQSRLLVCSCHGSFDITILEILINYCAWPAQILQKLEIKTLYIMHSSELHSVFLSISSWACVILVGIQSRFASSWMGPRRFYATFPSNWLWTLLHFIEIHPSFTICSSCTNR